MNQINKKSSELLKKYNNVNNDNFQYQPKKKNDMSIFIIKKPKYK